MAIKIKKPIQEESIENNESISGTKVENQSSGTALFILIAVILIFALSGLYSSGYFSYGEGAMMVLEFMAFVVFVFKVAITYLFFKYYLKLLKKYNEDIHKFIYRKFEDKSKMIPFMIKWTGYILPTIVAIVFIW